MNDLEEMPFVSIIFICWNRRIEVETTLNELNKIQYINKEIIIVDNGSEDETYEYIKENFPEVQIIRLDKNIGIEAYNIAAQKCRSEYIFVLDDDSHLQTDAINKAINIFKTDSNIGVIGFKIEIPSTGYVATKGWKRYITNFWGCGFAVRRKVIEKVGFYDKDLFLYTNEYDFAVRVWEAGYKVIYEDSITAYHRVSQMNRVGGRLIEYSVRNDIFFNIKYIPFPYIIYTMLNNLFIWLIRSITENCLDSWGRGLVRGIKECKSAIKKRKVVKKDILKFYLKNHRNFENPVSKFIRKFKDGTLVNRVKNV